MNSNKTERIPFWRDSAKRNIAFQVLVLGTLLFMGYLMFSNLTSALEKQNIATGFSFLAQEAAFDISDTLIDYSAESSFGRALMVGLVNTLLVALLGNFLAIIWGTLIGLASLSKNWPLTKLAKIYVTMLRNVPLLLQLFFWYSIITETLPPVRKAIELIPYTFLSNRGLVMPILQRDPSHSWILFSLFLGFVAAFVLYCWQKKRQEEKGKIFPFFRTAIAIILLPPLLTWLIAGAPYGLNAPELAGFNFQGGVTIGPEFTALLLGLVLYTGAFIAEIVRSGIQAVNKGQWEAAASLGLTGGQMLSLVILPQALRVIIPPLTSQMLNLTKNSSLAVAIGYFDFVNVSNTTMNQTGQAIECIALIMAVYLTFSLLTSLFMNWYNHKTQLVTR